MVTNDQYLDSVERQLRWYEAKIDDRYERVFMGYVQFKDVEQEIRFLQRQARPNRFILDRAGRC